jgi:hypothetical protein
MTIFVVGTLSDSTAPYAGRFIAFSNWDGVNDYNNSSFMGFLRQSDTGLGPYRNGTYVSNNTGSYGVPYLWECWYDGTKSYATV